MNTISPVEDAAYSASLENEHWGNPTLNERYSRVKDRVNYRKRIEEMNIGKDVNPRLARRFHKVYGDKAVAEREFADQKFKEGLKEYFENK